MALAADRSGHRQFKSLRGGAVCTGRRCGDATRGGAACGGAARGCVISGGAAHDDADLGGGAARDDEVRQVPASAAMPVVVAVDLAVGRRLRSAGKRQWSGQEWQGTWEARGRLHLCAAQQIAEHSLSRCAAGRSVAWSEGSERSKRSGVNGTARTFHERSSAPSRQDVCRMGSAHRRAHAGSGRCHDRLGLRAKSIARLARGKHHDDTRQAVGVRVRRGRAARSAEVQEAAHTLSLRVLNCHWERT